MLTRSEIEKCIKAITQIGNAIALARCIRTALMDYNSQNGKLLTNDNINDYNQFENCLKISDKERIKKIMKYIAFS